MDGNRKKELKDQYKQMRPEMGVYEYRCLETGKVYLGASNDLKGTRNSITFQLKSGAFLSNPRIQRDWKEYGQDGFQIAILERLEYEKDDEGSRDYTQDIIALKELWREKLEGDGVWVEDINQAFKKRGKERG